MPHIALPPEHIGIRGAMAFRPDTARPLNELAEVLLAGPSTLTKGERELIATFVSSRNCTHFCASIHGAIAAAHLGGDEALVKQVKTDFTQANISSKLKALLAIAGKVQQDGKLVTGGDVAAARELGATDLEIHDTVLIAAAFCMYNCYVDGLGTVQPDDEALYRERGWMVARDGYVRTSKQYLAEATATASSR
jgi:uncharacterized peroxidase-related enzyme